MRLVTGPRGGDDGRRGVRGDIETLRVEARQGRSMKGCASRAGPPRCPLWQRPGQPNRRHRLRIPINPTSCSSSNPPAIAIRFRHPGCSGWLSRASAELSTVAGGRLRRIYRPPSWTTRVSPPGLCGSDSRYQSEIPFRQVLPACAPPLGRIDSPVISILCAPLTSRSMMESKSRSDRCRPGGRANAWPATGS